MKTYVETNTHIYFWNNYLSNFYIRKNLIYYKGEVFNSSEHLFMFLKAIHFKDRVAATGKVKIY